MSTQLATESNVDTDCTPCTNVENNNVDDTQPLQPQSDAPQTEKPSYEVVFFAKYYESYPRPSEEDITKFFNNYGTVHHIKCPEDRDFAFVFMSDLSTTEEHRRTRVTISQIIKDMTPETKFRVTVASSNRPRYDYNNNNGYNNNSYNNNSYNNQPQNYNNYQPQRRNQHYNNYNQGYNRGYNNQNYDQGYQGSRGYNQGYNQHYNRSSNQSYQQGSNQGSSHASDQSYTSRPPRSQTDRAYYYQQDTYSAPRQNYAPNRPPRQNYQNRPSNGSYDMLNEEPVRAPRPQSRQSQTQYQTQSQSQTQSQPRNGGGSTQTQRSTRQAN